jgi:hypothetical protein
VKVVLLSGNIKFVSCVFFKRIVNIEKQSDKRKKTILEVLEIVGFYQKNEC